MVEFDKRSLEVLDILNNKGFEAYLVGGCVRDYLLNKEINDYDITTSAKPEEVEQVFQNYKVIRTGIKHGTVTVIYKHLTFEITTFRVESTYLDNRHPDKVEFVSSLKDDLERRDFTINALAYNKKVIDYFDGISDLSKGIIKCVGNPDKRFKEDALRILRAIRFKTKLGFKIDKLTDIAIHNNKELIKNISIERIIQELNQIFDYDPYTMFNDYFDLLEIIFPNLINIDKTKLIEEIKEYKNNHLFVYAKIFKYNFDYKLLKKYHFSNEMNKKIKLLNLENLIVNENIISIKKILLNYSFNDMILYVKYNFLEEDKSNKLISLLTLANKECHNLEMLAINGKDLIELGITDGKEIKKTLDYLLNLVIEGRINNNIDALKSVVISLNK